MDQATDQAAGQATDHTDHTDHTDRRQEHVPNPFRYSRRVEFAETDMAGIVPFSIVFRYMEEAEHALWRAAGLAIATPGEEVGWPRVAAAFDYKAPLRFQEEFEVTVEVASVSRRTIDYAFDVILEGRTIGR